METFGTIPTNRGFRPVVTTLNAIDYWLGNGLNSRAFHTTYFIYYLIQLVVLFFFLKNFFTPYFSTPSKSLFLSLVITCFYGLHTANAETINYIISRSDQFSTLLMLLGLLLYQYKTPRKFFLYLIPVIVSMGTKELTIMFPFLLFSLILCSKDKLDLKISFFKSVPSLIILTILFYLIISNLPHFNTIIGTSIYNRLIYLFTQSIVIIHYLANYFLPIDLSVDSDFILINSLINQKAIYSFFFLTILVFFSLFALTKKKLQPIGFGLLWFFIVLIPTSSIKPMGQIANDHRTFMPYIGLTIAFIWSIYLIYIKLIEKFKSKRKIILTFCFSGLIISLCFHSYGIYQRNIVWSSSELLWKDGVEKSPNNGRVLMNYGLSLMAKGKYEETLPYFEKSLTLNPYWAYIHINMGILKNAMGKKEEAESFFKKAILYQPLNPESYYFYARFLNKESRGEDALSSLEKGLKISPNHSGLRQFHKSLSLSSKKVSATQLMDYEKELDSNPNAENYINLSLNYYKIKEYKKCIETCKKVLKLNPNSSLAYNNICSSYNALQEWEKAKIACENAIRINPKMQIAKNNLNWSNLELKKQNH